MSESGRVKDFCTTLEMHETVHFWDDKDGLSVAAPSLSSLSRRLETSKTPTLPLQLESGKVSHKKMKELW